jgi:hypothetical protein
MPRCRPFRFVDAMILIAAAAASMAWVRTRWISLHMIWMTRSKGIPWFDHARMVHAGLTDALLMLAVAYVWIRLIPPRLPRSDLVRQPGMLFLGLMIGLMVGLWILVVDLSVFVPRVDLTKLAWTNMIMALALGLSWGAARRRYRSRAEPGWIEGLGRFVGVGLVVAIAASYPLYLLAA